MLSLVHRGDPDAPPLLLIHDGGGTTYSYHSLTGFPCDIYAIDNPRLHSGRAWPGGIRAMARAYSAVAHTGLPARQVVLGGWSFGGMVALEMVAMLRRYKFDVLGVLLLDTVCPESWMSPRAVFCEANAPTFAPRSIPLDSHVLVSKMMEQSVDMASKWDAPHWDTARHDDVDSDSGSDCSCCDLDTLHDEAGAHSKMMGPPVVLLRCSERVERDAIVRVDASRDCKSLGWDHFRPGLITKTLSLNTHHFGMFAPKNIDQTVAKSSEALELLYQTRWNRSHG